MFVAGALPALVLVPLMIRYLSGPDAQGATAMPVTRSGRASRETISRLFRGVQPASDAGVLDRHVHGSVADLRAQHFHSFAAVGSVDLDIRVRPVSDLVTPWRGHGNLCKFPPPAGPSALRLRGTVSSPSRHASTR